MEIVIVIVCVGTGLNLALWGALCRRLDRLPAAFLARARRERREGEARALAVLQEEAAAKVGAITTSLRALEEQHEARSRDERAAAELRARVAERRAQEAAPALVPAVELVRELRAMIDRLTESEEPAACAPTEDRVTPTLPTGRSSQRVTFWPPEATADLPKERAS
jgi:small-conductance mechanosensitive channel